MWQPSLNGSGSNPWTAHFNASNTTWEWSDHAAARTFSSSAHLNTSTVDDTYDSYDMHLDFENAVDSLKKVVLNSKQKLQVINFSVSVASGTALICQSFALWMVLLCKSLPTHIKQPSVSFLLSDCLALLSVVTIRIIVLGFSFKTPQLNSAQIVIAGALFAVSRATVTFMSIDRLLACTQPFFHKYRMTSSNVRAALVTTWVFNLGLTFVMWILSSIYTDEYNSRIEEYFLESFPLLRRCIFGLNAIFPLISMLAFIKLIWHLRMPRSNVLSSSFQKRFNKVTRMLGTIIVIHLVLGLPYIVHFLLAEALPHMIKDYRGQSIRVLGYICLIANSCFNAFFYTLQIKECRKNAAYKLSLLGHLFGCGTKEDAKREPSIHCITSTKVNHIKGQSTSKDTI